MTCIGRIWATAQENLPLFYADNKSTEQLRPQGYKTFFMLNSAEQEIYPAHKCLNANYC